ncbi:MAG: LysM peptidoglycan-binding domain-containing protein, partial [Bacteroidia bacterium]|nr:LysM peptidoglycan-binding domain-containing protein [Bacteroidia bacterium]
MKHLLILASLFFIVTGFSSEGLAQDRYRSHQVLAGETVYSIAQKYKIPEAEIYRLNPDARKGIGLGSILIIPSEMIIQSGSEPVDFKRHKVRRKETLFSISQKYNITVDDIKKYNKHLYSKGLKKGEKLQIPIFPKVESTATVVTNNETNNAKAESQTHIIQAKETKYGIARKYGITIAELEAMNPDVPANFPIGSILNVPNNSVTESATIEESTFDFYEVQPKEGFFRLKVKLGLTEEEIVALNPYAKDGLKAGMILKIPKESATGLDTGRVNKINLEERINDRSRKRVAVL